MEDPQGARPGRLRVPARARAIARRSRKKALANPFPALSSAAVPPPPPPGPLTHAPPLPRLLAQLVKGLTEARGNGTSMISLVIPLRGR